MRKELRVEITNCGLDGGPRVGLEDTGGNWYCYDYEEIGTRNWGEGNSGKWVEFKGLREGNEFVCEELSCRFRDPDWLRRCCKEFS